MPRATRFKKGTMVVKRTDSYRTYGPSRDTYCMLNPKTHKTSWFTGDFNQLMNQDVRISYWFGSSFEVQVPAEFIQGG